MCVTNSDIPHLFRRIQMEKSKFTRLLAFAFVLALCMTICGATALFANDTASSGSSGSDTFAEALEQLNDITWSTYYARYSGMKKYTGEPIVIKASGYTGFSYPSGMTDKDAALPFEKLDELDGRKDVLQTPDIGTVDFKVTVPEDGLYSIEWDYYPIQAKASNIERTLRINGEVPFTEVRNLMMTKIWKDEFKYDENGSIVFDKDASGNDARPQKYEAPEWRTYYVSDPTGYTNGSFWFYLKAGENTISITGQREPVVLDEIRLTAVREEITYEEYRRINDAKPNNASAAAPIKIEAENPSSTSDKTLYPDNDRSSSINSPQHASYILCNVIGGSNWSTMGQWIEWTVTVPEDGYYKIYSRYLQNVVQGLYVSRRLRVDGEIPFYEANNTSFVYNSDWQLSALGTDETVFDIYLEKGTHTFSLEVTLGKLGGIISEVRSALTEINNIYLKILSITGPAPDSYQDYKFYSRIPSEIKRMRELSAELFDIANRFEQITGGGSSNQATLEKIARRLETMSKNSERQIAKNFKGLKTDIGNLGTWLNTVQSQTLKIDYLVVAPSEATLDKKEYKAKGNFFENFGFEISAFVWSFFRDNSSFGAVDVGEGKTELVVWTTISRERAQLVRDLVSNNFSSVEPNISVNMKVVSAGALLPAVFAGVGPDIMMEESSSNVINYAVRGAVVNLYDCEGFQSLKGRFHKSAWIPLTVALDSPDGEKAVYGIPLTQSFSIMFYRKDILAELGITKAPETWDEFETVSETLISNNYEVGMGYNEMFNIFLYQKGGELYTNGGTTISYDTDVALDAFTEMCELYTHKKFPKTYDAANRFRTGEIPIIIADYITFYNQFTIFATELNGLWGFTNIPGTVREDGTVDKTTIGSVTAMVVMRDAEEKKNTAFKFMEWWMRTEIQSAYANELVALLGPAGKYATANYEAFSEMSWSASESKVLKAQFDVLKCMPEMPGSYIISRYVNFAYLEVYNNGANPSDQLMGYVDTINREMERKREELKRNFYVPSNYDLFG